MKYTILKAGKSVRFHLKHGLFNFSEQFSDLTSGIAGFLLFPFYIWLITKLWEKFNAYQGNYTLQEILLYIGITEILFMTFLSPTSLSRSSADFSLSCSTAILAWHEFFWSLRTLSGLSHYLHNYFYNNYAAFWY